MRQIRKSLISNLFKLFNLLNAAICSVRTDAAQDQVTRVQQVRTLAPALVTTNKNTI